MTLDSWLADVAVKQKILQRSGNKGHSVFEIFLLSPLHLTHFFFLCINYNIYPHLSLFKY